MGLVLKGLRPSEKKPAVKSSIIEVVKFYNFPTRIDTAWKNDYVCDLFPGDFEANTILNELDQIEKATCVKFERKSSSAGLTRYIDVHKYTG